MYYGGTHIGKPFFLVDMLKMDIMRPRAALPTCKTLQRHDHSFLHSSILPNPQRLLGISKPHRFHQLKAFGRSSDSNPTPSSVWSTTSPTQTPIPSQSTDYSHHFKAPEQLLQQLKAGLLPVSQADICSALSTLESIPNKSTPNRAQKLLLAVLMHLPSTALQQLGGATLAQILSVFAKFKCRPTSSALESMTDELIRGSTSLPKIYTMTCNDLSTCIASLSIIGGSDLIWHHLSKAAGIRAAEASLDTLVDWAETFVRCNQQSHVLLDAIAEAVMQRESPSSSQVVQLLSAYGSAYYAHEALVPPLINASKLYTKDFSPRQIVAVLEACMDLRSPPGKELLAEITFWSQVKIKEFGPAELTALASCLANSGHRDNALVTSLSYAATKQVQSFTPLQTVEFMWAMSTWQHYDTHLCAAVCQKVLGILPTYPPAALAALLFALSCIGHYDQALFSTSARALKPFLTTALPKQIASPVCETPHDTAHSRGSDPDSSITQRRRTLRPRNAVDRPSRSTSGINSGRALRTRQSSGYRRTEPHAPCLSGNASAATVYFTIVAALVWTFFKPETAPEAPRPSIWPNWLSKGQSASPSPPSPPPPASSEPQNRSWPAESQSAPVSHEAWSSILSSTLQQATASPSYGMELLAATRENYLIPLSAANHPPPSPLTLFHLAWAFAATRHYDEAFLSDLSRATTPVVARLEPNQIAGILGSFADLNAIDSTLSEEAGAALQGRTGDLGFEGVSAALWGLAMAGNRNQHLLQSLFNRAAGFMLYSPDLADLIRLRQAWLMLYPFVSLYAPPGLHKMFDRAAAELELYTAAVSAARMSSIQEFMNGVCRTIVKLGYTFKQCQVTPCGFFIIDIVVGMENGKTVAIDLVTREKMANTGTRVLWGGAVAQRKCLEVEGWPVVSFNEDQWRALEGDDREQRKFLTYVLHGY